MTVHRQLHVGATLLMLAVGAVLASAQSGAKLPADLDPDSRARLPYLQRKDMDEKSQKIFDTLPGRSAEGVLRGPLAFAAYNPGVAQALFALHNAAVGEGAVMSTYAVSGFYAIAVDEHMPAGSVDLESAARP